MNIDASNLILGRMCAFAARRALLGEEVNIFNCSKAVITGNRAQILGKYRARMERGTHTTGPFQPKAPFRFVKRALRGMLPYKSARGRSAFKRVKCYNSVPDGFKGGLEQVSGAGIEDSLTSKYIFVGELCRLMGGKIE